MQRVIFALLIPSIHSERGLRRQHNRSPATSCHPNPAASSLTWTVVRSSPQRYIQLRETSITEDDTRQQPQLDGGLSVLSGDEGANKKTFAVSSGRVPVHDVLRYEEEIASREGFQRVKVSLRACVPSFLCPALPASYRRLPLAYRV